MTSAILTPVTTDLATAVGPRVFRKQLLPVGSIDYKGQRLDFSRPYLQQLASSFTAGAYDSVKFFLAPDDNRHTVDPERMRGTVKALELSDDGLDAVIELTDDGAQVVRDHPDLGVSARIVQDLAKSDGRRYPAAIQHVLGTVDPVVTGMKPWSAVDLSETTDSDVDLTSATFDEGTSAMADLTDAQKARLDQLLGLPDEQFTALVMAPPATTTTEPDEAKRGLWAKLRGKTAPDADESDLTEAELEAIAEQIATDAEEHANSEQTVSLSADAQAAIDLAQAQSAQALAGNLDLASRLADSQWTADRATLARKGVPPAILDLAEPVLKLPAGVIDLSNSSDGAPDPIEALRKVVHACEGMVDLSVIGEIPEQDETSEQQAAAVARQFIAEHGFGPRADAAKTSKES